MNAFGDSVVVGGKLLYWNSIVEEPEDYLGDSLGDS